MKKQLIASTAVLASLLTIGGPAFAASSTSQNSNTTTNLTTAQIQATISEVNPVIITKNNGEVKISHEITSLNLSPQQLSFVDQSVAAYNQKVSEGIFDTANHMDKTSEANLAKFKSSHISNTSSTQISSATTTGEFGLPSSWFYSYTPQAVYYGYWWGNQVVLNQTATVDVEAFLGVSGVYGSAAAGKQAVIDAVGAAGAEAINQLSMAGVAYGALMVIQDSRGAGDNLQFLDDWVPFTVAGNWA
jgi:hypothetical protein